MNIDAQNEPLPSAPEDADRVDEHNHPETIALWMLLIEVLVSLDRRVSATTADTPQDILLELRDRILVLQQRAAALREKIDEKFVEAIQAHGPMEVGHIRYVVGIDRTTRCLNTRGTTEAVLEAVGGELGKFCEQLVSQPFKPASVRGVLDVGKYKSCFETVEKSGVEKLMRVDTRYVRLGR